MNALQRDLKRLVPMVEAAGASAAADLHRQKLHVQPPVGWLNDPNGLCQIGDEYHVFYQYGPFDPTGGVKHWGHVRSRDLFHWERLPVMLYPDERRLFRLRSGGGRHAVPVLYRQCQAPRRI